MNVSSPTHLHQASSFFRLTFPPMWKPESYATWLHQRNLLYVESADSDDDVAITLTRWWKELLGVDKVGMRDDFFDLGGQSLTGVRLLAKVKKKYGVDLKLATLFSAPTIEKLCAAGG